MRAELDLVSYDRLFPAQDFMPKGSFGNLIALPLHGECRKTRNNRVYRPSHPGAFRRPVDVPVDTPSPVGPVRNRAGRCARGSRRPGPMPRRSADRPTGLQGQNHRPRSMRDPRQCWPSTGSACRRPCWPHSNTWPHCTTRSSTRRRGSASRGWNTPRFIRCYRETLDQLLLPRGLRDKAHGIVADAGSELVIADGCADPPSLRTALSATLTPEQATAAADLGKHRPRNAGRSSGIGQDGRRLRPHCSASSPDARDRGSQAVDGAMARTGRSPTSTSIPSRSASSAAVAPKPLGSSMSR